MSGSAKSDLERRVIMEDVLRYWRRFPGTPLGAFLLEAVGADTLGVVDDVELSARLGAFVKGHAKSIEIPELGFKDVLFFGCWATYKIGHFLWYRDGNHVLRGDDVNPPLDLDGRYCGSTSMSVLRGNQVCWEADAVSQPQNRARVVIVGPWTIMAFWDRTADTRYACNGAFLARGYLNFEQMCEIAQRHFPSVWARLTAKEPMLQAVD